MARAPLYENDTCPHYMKMTRAHIRRCVLISQGVCPHEKSELGKNDGRIMWLSPSARFRRHV